MNIPRMLNQTAVYWAPDGYDSFGEPTTGSPEEVSCRWEDVTEQFITLEGEEKLSRSKVYLDQDVALGGKLFLGELDDLNGYGPPDDGAYEILRVDKVPSVRADQNLRVVML